MPSTAGTVPMVASHPMPRRKNKSMPAVQSATTVMVISNALTTGGVKVPAPALAPAAEGPGNGAAKPANGHGVAHSSVYHMSAADEPTMTDNEIPFMAPGMDVDGDVVMLDVNEQDQHKPNVFALHFPQLPTKITIELMNQPDSDHVELVPGTPSETGINQARTAEPRSETNVVRENLLM